MSAAALAATLAVAFVGGAGGAILGPWITHRLSSDARLAERRAEPYERILAAGLELLNVTTEKAYVYEEEPDYLRVWHDARESLESAAASADAVTTKEIRALVEKLTASCMRAVAAARDVPDVPDDQMWAAIEPLSRAWTNARTAYDQLRDQVQRETRG